uniref:TIL domain-containing protein n=1 Tax=Parastrongyloides trichosuri TaxID=131310 RepID=A0A0N4ZCI0_PARTI
MAFKILFLLIIQSYGEINCPEGQVYDACIGFNTTCSYLNLSKESIGWPRICSGGCKCKDNKYLDKDGNCVEMSECTKYETTTEGEITLQDSNNCPPNSEYTKCSAICPEKNCLTINTRPFCFSLRCGLPKCQCKEGYVRRSGNEENSVCVKISSCPSQRIIRRV